VESGAVLSRTLTKKEFALSGTEVRTAETEFLEGCRAGSLPTFERLYQAHGGPMKSIALNLLGNVADAEDAVQEAFLKVYRGARRFRGGSSFSTWLYRILVNTCYDLLRKRRRRAEGPLPADVALISGRESDHPLRLSIEVALRRLDFRERTVFLLCEVEGFSHREAAEVLDVNENTSRTLLFRAKKQLQRSLSSAGAFAPVEVS
jgi:RNA polymerase sigma-70 factor (ECF subfamily)